MDYEKYRSDELRKYTDHFSKEYSKDIVDFAESAFPDYLFTRKEKGQQYGYCTACKREFKTENLKHKAHTKCPHCNENLYVQSSAMSRTKMINEVYFIYYEKSIIDPNVIVARGIYAVEDYRPSNYKQVKPQMIDKTLYIFKIGESVMLKRYVWYSWSEFKMGSPYTGSYANFKIASTVHSELHAWALNNQARGFACFSRDSIKAAVTGTPFQYSMWEAYDDEPMVKFFDLYCKYPKTVEYLTKLGFVNFIDAKFTGDCTCGAINWRGNTVFQMLRLNRFELKQLRNSDYYITPFYLRLYQINKKGSNRMSMHELTEVENAFGVNQVKDIQVITKHASLKKTFIYIKKQYETCKSRDGNRHFHSIINAMLNYRDYIKDCQTLAMDMKNDRILFPKNLYNAHQNTITQVKVTENKRLNEKIAKRVPGLNQRYYFESSGLLIRPARDTRELIEEGKALSHCVGTYADRYANGRTNILFIRKASAPDKSYYTMEIGSDNRIIQIHGKGNCGVNREIEDFINAFTDEKLKGKKSKIAKSA